MKNHPGKKVDHAEDAQNRQNQHPLETKFVAFSASLTTVARITGTPLPALSADPAWAAKMLVVWSFGSSAQLRMGEDEWL